MLTQKQIIDIFNRFQKANPTPKTELYYTNTYTFLVAVILSAQSTDKGVNKVTEKLFETIDTPEKMIEWGQENLEKTISSIGLYRAKAKNIISLSEILINKHQSQVPSTREDLEDLPGVGRKSANVVLNVIFGQKTVAVDTHVFRVSQRIGLCQGKTPHDVEKKLMDVIPSQYLDHAAHWLVLHGRYICKSRRPLCEQCFLNDVCEYFQQNKKEGETL